MTTEDLAVSTKDNVDALSELLAKHTSTEVAGHPPFRCSCGEKFDGIGQHRKHIAETISAAVPTMAVRALRPPTTEDPPASTEEDIKAARRVAEDHWITNHEGPRCVACGWWEPLPEEDSALTARRHVAEMTVTSVAPTIATRGQEPLQAEVGRWRTLFGDIERGMKFIEQYDQAPAQLAEVAAWLDGLKCMEWNPTLSEECGRPAAAVPWGTLYRKEQVGPKCREHFQQHHEAKLTPMRSAIVYLDDLRTILTAVQASVLADVRAEVYREASKYIAGQQNTITGRSKANAELFGLMLWHRADDIVWQAEQTARNTRTQAVPDHEIPADTPEPLSPADIAEQERRA